MPDPKQDPRRRCMPFDEWPPADQNAWTQATKLGDPFEGSGLAAHWREGTKRKIVSAYGRWLTFLLQRGLLDGHAPPGARMNIGHLRAYVDELRAQVSPVTLAGRITDLLEAFRVMVPTQTMPYLRRAQQLLSARASPSRDKRQKYIHPSLVFERTLKLLDRIERESCQREVWRAGRFRDGLFIAILCSRAPRLRNLGGMKIGQHLVRAGDRYLMRFKETETKGKRPMEQTLPSTLTRYVDRYLDHHRPMLLRARTSDRIWISNHGTDMAEMSIYFRVREVTKREFGVARNPHSFRDGVPTSLAIDDPKHVGAASAILGHSDPRTTERHYNLAKSMEAVRSHQENIRRLRSFRREDQRSNRILD
jgi:integrase/recombinase XerD